LGSGYGSTTMRSLWTTISRPSPTRLPLVAFSGYITNNWDRITCLGCLSLSVLSSEMGFELQRFNFDLTVYFNCLLPCYAFILAIGIVVDGYPFRGVAYVESWRLASLNYKSCWVSTWALIRSVLHHLKRLCLSDPF
jgi:hypothetical protein